MSDLDWLQNYLNDRVVVEIGDGFTVFGTLIAVGDDHIELRDADLHNQLEANSTREVYAYEIKQIGIRPNRASIAIPRQRLIAISLIEDILP